MVRSKQFHCDSILRMLMISKNFFCVGGRVSSNIAHSCMKSTS